MLKAGVSRCAYSLTLVVQLRNKLSIGWIDRWFMHWVNGGQIKEKPFQQPVHWAGTSPFGLSHPRTRTELRGTWEGRRRQSPGDPSQSKKVQIMFWVGKGIFFNAQKENWDYQSIPEVMIHRVTKWVKTKGIMKQECCYNQFRIWFVLTFDGSGWRVRVVSGQTVSPLGRYGLRPEPVSYIDMALQPRGAALCGRSCGLSKLLGVCHFRVLFSFWREFNWKEGTK